MALFGGMVDLGIAFLIVVALAEYIKFRNKADKGFSWLAVAGVLFLFAGASAADTTISSYAPGVVGASGALTSLFGVVGWVFALVGTLFIIYQVIVEK
ncbi:hypothetical protein EPN87_04540 [archaeon]|nr:MAG: hypothetical protein EPN87_04540 [archaeon]